MAKFLIADDHPLFRQALIGALEPLFEDLHIVESDSLESTLDALKEHTDITLTLLDLTMPGCDNYYGLTQVQKEFPNMPVAVVSASDSLAVVANVMELGAKGFISKTSPVTTTASALTEIMKGNTWLAPEIRVAITNQITSTEIAEKVSELTPKQYQVLKLLQGGLLNKQIASDLNITEATVKAHISAILRKLNVNTRTQAVLLLKDLEID